MSRHHHSSQSFQPKDMITPNDPVSHLAEIGKNMGKKLKRVDVKTIKELATMTDRDISIATSKTVFISTDKFNEFRQAAIRVVDAFETEQQKDVHLEQVAEEQKMEESKGKSNNQGEDLFTPSDNNSQKSVEMTKIKK